MALNGTEFDKKCNLEVWKHTSFEIFNWSTVLDDPRNAYTPEIQYSVSIIFGCQ